ncbi:hypothetical protein CLI78_02265 [Porphyromonas gingivalis]|nr:hypothetical protein CLI78_02265 [Porphyromonas gingivalis]
MIGGMTSSLSSQPKVEGTLLTAEQVEEISSRIARSVKEQISKQLEKYIASSSVEVEKSK